MGTALNIYIQVFLQVYVFISLLKVPRRPWLGHMVKCIFSFIINCQSLFSSVYYNTSHFHQKCTSNLVAPHPRQHLLWSAFLVLMEEQRCLVALHCISLSLLWTTAVSCMALHGTLDEEGTVPALEGSTVGVRGLSYYISLRFEGCLCWSLQVNGKEQVLVVENLENQTRNRKSVLVGGRGSRAGAKQRADFAVCRLAAFVCSAHWNLLATSLLFPLISLLHWWRQVKISRKCSRRLCLTDIHPKEFIP